jgi:hypothetical protein
MTAENGLAAEHYNAGVTLMLAAWPGASEHFEAALAADPHFALPYAALARIHATRADPVAAKLLIGQAERLIETEGTQRERSHIRIIALTVTNQPKQALAGAIAHTDQWPRDVMILSLLLGAFGLLAFSGMADHDRARVDLCERHVQHFDADDWWFLTYHGWALAENGEVARGLAMLEQGFGLYKDNANGVHALVHAMFEAGAHEATEALIAQWLPDYDRSGILHGHIAWHAALIALEHGNAERALEIYASQVQPAVSLGMPINIVSDAASLLWRLGICGHDVPGSMWGQLAEYAEHAFPKAGHAFVDAHMMLIAAASGNQAALEQRVTALEAIVASQSIAAGIVVPTIGRAAMAFVIGDNATCSRSLESVMPDVVRIGGSGAQRELVEDTLIAALIHGGELQKARVLLDRRLERRPSLRDERWRSQLSA